MHRFAVWAPARDQVDVVVDGRRSPMQRQQDGWWTATEAAGPGSRYGFSLDGGSVRPDPRSPSQPDGVLGLSQVIDHAAYQWSDGAWGGLALRGLVLYELHIGAFSPSGTFEAAISKLPHLVELGVDAIELMPVAEFSGDHGWGYDGVDLFAPHHALGGPHGLKRLVDSCHAAGLGVVMDAVYNHLGPVGNFLAEFGPYFSDRHRTNWGVALNFDGPGSKEVRRFVIDNALMWIRDYHFDGLRLDAVHAMVDQSPAHILKQLTAEVKAAGKEAHRRVFVSAESALNEPRLVRSRAAGGYGLDAAWADDWHHALHAVLTGEQAGYYEDYGSFDQLAKALRQAWVYDGVWSWHRGRMRGGKTTGLSPGSFVVATQTHDQVGNRAKGERLSALVTRGKLKIASALLLTSPFTPLLFAGEEWAAGTPFLYFTDHAESKLGRAVFEGRRREFAAFGWNPDDVPDPQDPATFDRSKLRWDELDRPEHNEMLDWYRRLISLRRTLPLPRKEVGEDIAVEPDCDTHRLVVRRDHIVVRANLGPDIWSVGLDRSERIVLSSDRSIEERGRTVTLPPASVAIFETSARA